MAFDTCQELIWTGNVYGRVTSFYSTDLARYTSFMCHSSKEAGGAVRQILVNTKGIVVLSSRTLHMASRKGLTMWTLEHDAMKDMRCMSFTSKGTSEILVAGLQSTMLIVDLNRGEISKQIPTDHHYIIMRRGRYICAATSDGTVHLIDPINYTLTRAWPAHSALINGLDAQGDFVVTCGYSLRHGQTYMLDPFLNIFDIKKMIPMSPIPFPAGAAFVRMHPRMLTTGLVISQTGQIHVVDIMNPNASNVHQANVLSYLTMFEIAPSGEAAAFADAEGNIHLWGSPSKIHFVDLPTPVEFAASGEPQAPALWSDDFPLNSIGVPYYRDALFSAWPDFISDTGNPPQKLDLQWLASLNTLRNYDSTLFGKPRDGVRRNQVENSRFVDKQNSGLKAPKFLSEKAREFKMTRSHPRHKDDDFSDSFTLLGLRTSDHEIPVMYRPVEIKYSKFGIEDFDFGFYNQTHYSGLETHISNSYANPIIQIMHFTPLIRNTALLHAASSCISETCLLCELGYLFDMLEKAAGSVCQATNMLKALSHHQTAQALGLLEEDPRGLSLNLMLQRLTRFLAERIVEDSTGLTDDSFDPPNIISMEMSMNQMCTSCRNDSEKTRISNVTDLQYPQSLPTPVWIFTQRFLTLATDLTLISLCM
jgi:PAB-dependent poly(A)-specific ribonuclease subunit 2